MTIEKAIRENEVDVLKMLISECKKDIDIRAKMLHEYEIKLTALEERLHGLEVFDV